ncbi:hypothetical protein AB0395_33280 [Streptosporangium sp. NPDC051023]|uniref:hypothetical protein n=1 Tax=Streptosporangium sp. NPDC051023 TaxID=3155410 RepID=UPI00344E05B9
MRDGMQLASRASYWTMADIAEYLGARLCSVRTYRLRGQKGKPGGLSQGGKLLGRTAVWEPTAILRWERPRQGASGGRSHKDAPPESDQA